MACSPVVVEVLDLAILAQASSQVGSDDISKDVGLLEELPENVEDLVYVPSV